MGNRELIGAALEQLVSGLAPFVDHRMRTVEGEHWLAAYERADSERFGGNRSNTLHDPRFLLRVITERRDTFRPVLPRPGLSLASTLRRVGNGYAHDFDPAKFDAASTTEALGAAAELLRLAGATGQSRAVDALRREVTAAAPGAAGTGRGSAAHGRSGAVGDQQPGAGQRPGGGRPGDGGSRFGAGDRDAFAGGTDPFGTGGTATGFPGGTGTGGATGFPGGAGVPPQPGVPPQAGAAYGVASQPPPGAPARPRSRRRLPLIVASIAAALLVLCCGGCVGVNHAMGPQCPGCHWYQGW